jgi:hypothetical protein
MVLKEIKSWVSDKHMNLFLFSIFTILSAIKKYKKKRKEK